MNTIIIGIAGGTGSGKTTLTERLRDHFGIDEVSVINHNSYYKRHDELPYEERCKLNYDHPDSFDTPLMVAHLRELRAGHPVQVPVYDYTIHNRSNETVLVRPAPVIIVEGILIFDSPELCDLMRRVTGAGCMLTVLCGAFAAVQPQAPLQAAVQAAEFWKACAAAAEPQAHGPASFRVALLDAAAQIV